MEETTRKTSRILEDNGIMDLREIGLKSVDWLKVGPVAGSQEQCSEPSFSTKGGEFLD
jgi:hypothetical protein